MKGGVTVESTVLFGKYQICRILGRGMRGTVFLVRHIVLSEYRAVKCVPREQIDNDSLLREAMILKSLRYPGIPIIYDLEQDEHFYYLIEEYLQGESLYALVTKHGTLSQAKTIRYGIELCQIMQYLHSLRPNPILYLDLQPKNLLICDGVLKLIDFDQAVWAFPGQILKKRYGTVGCAAPEQFTEEPMGIQTDIYAIGALLHYMQTGRFPSDPSVCLEGNAGEKLAAVIRQCLRPSKDERYADAESVLKELLKLRSGVFSQKSISLLKIAIVGSSRGMGVTHTSFGLSLFLSRSGNRALYTECNENDLVRKMAKYAKLSPDLYGIYHCHGLNLRPKYGECVKLKLPEYDVLLEDFAERVEAVPEDGDYDLILLLCGGKWWEVHDSIRAARLLSERKNVKVLINHCFLGQVSVLSNELSKLPCFRLPQFTESEAIKDEMEAFWTKVMKGTEIENRLLSGESANVKKISIFNFGRRR